MCTLKASGALFCLIYFWAHLDVLLGFEFFILKTLLCIFFSLLKCVSNNNKQIKNVNVEFVAIERIANFTVIIGESPQSQTLHQN